MNAEKRDFLVEIGTEELPPKALRLLEQAFAGELASGLAKAGLKHGETKSFATPRRLAVLIRRLTARQPDQKIERRGPPVSAAFDAEGLPTRAAQSFAAAWKTSMGELQRRDEGKGTFLYYVGIKAGAAAVELLPGLVQSALDALPIPRRMHWGAGEAQFVRPVHWIAMLYGKEIVPARLLDTASGNLTRGHRFHAPKPLRLSSPNVYERTLRERGYVVADFAARRSLIREGVAALAAGLGGRPLMSDELLDEVTSLVEWPVPLAGRFEERFLSLPREVLISTLEDHQRYFPVEDADGTLLPHFITVANIESSDPAKVVEGNQRVVRPRLADAAFFWEQDRKSPLAARAEGLAKVTFQAKLGSLGDKTRRVGALAAEIAQARARSEAHEAGPVTRARRAAELCKCDLLTAMVGEFPELQGIMGTYYALADGEEAEVATAIREHYRPRGAGDDLPLTETGTTLAIADKLDTLAAIFAIGGKPTGTKDPFGLRRAAIGVIRILIEKRLELDLARLLDRAVARVGADIEKAAAAAGKPAPALATASIAAEVHDYVLERLRAYYLERATGASSITTEMFDAVLATRPASPLDLDTRLAALSNFLTLPESASLTAANKRVANILRKAGESAPAEIDQGALQVAAERQLFEAMGQLRDRVAAATARKDYAGALALLAQLRPTVDAFFDQVMVMDEDPKLRANRLALLARMRELFAGVADLSRLPG
ncbi:MAG TPA: glycine--tRNA ligase subunit beta [Steroidobacteraceae bacterium]|jgi:glycyl-tRNA synthetase beta chain|nr:glycine--tRNA ligase subunit beta [Steroidobacteraceae bacterium]